MGLLSSLGVLVANTVALGVIALAFGGYLHETVGGIPTRDAAIAAALVMTTINAVGIRRSVSVTDVIVIFSVLSRFYFQLRMC